MNFNFKNLDFAQSKKLLQFAIENRMIENLDIDSIHPLLALENASLLNLSEDQIDSIFDRSENKEEVIRISSITTDKMHKWCADMAISENDIKGYEPKYGVFSIDKFLQNKLGSLNHAANLRSLIFDVLHHNYHMKHDNEGKLKYFYIPLCLYKDVLHLCNIIFNHNMKVFYYDNSVGESVSGWNVIENKFLVITSIGEAVNERFLTYEEYVKEFILEKVNENH